LRVAVFAAADRVDDARYVRAALGAAAEAAGMPLEVWPAGAQAVSVTATAPGLPAADDPSLGSTARPAADLTFWLGDAPPPPALLAATRAGATLITDAGLREESCRGSVVAAVGTVPVAMRRCGAAAASARDATAAAGPPRTRWRSDTGRSVLVERSLGSGHWLQVASRFHPAWSDLVLSPAFPEWLRDVLRAAAEGGATAELPASDRRGDGGQGRPATAPMTGHETAAPPPSSTPERTAWLLLFPLLLLERWVATRQ